MVGGRGHNPLKILGENMNHENQLKTLLDLGLKIHPLKEDNCWGIYASTQEKAVERFYRIKKAFPKATPKKLNHNLEGDFGIDLYGE